MKDLRPYERVHTSSRRSSAFIKDFFRSSLTLRLRTYVLRLLASCLEGTNREQCYYTFIGEGSNGKVGVD
jgi:phage/plasmid-associated DNA primase